MAGKKIIVTQVRSAIGRDKRQRRTLSCLGLGRIGRSVEHSLDPSVLGMIRSVSHMVSVRECG